jgi:hypothetical protein
MDDRRIAGTGLIREWQGAEHCVTLLHEGYEYRAGPAEPVSSCPRHHRHALERLFSSG